MVNIAAAVGNTVADKRSTATNTNSSNDATTKDITESINDSSTLDKDAFFKLLITQLRYQDPLKPMENKEFISQMAQFSSLEQMQNMNENMRQFTKIQSLSEGAALIGKTVESYEDADGNIIKGVVDKVVYEDDEIYLYLEDESLLTLDNIQTIY